MAALNQDFTKYRGDEFVLQFSVIDVVDLTGYTASWKMAVDENSTALVTKSSPSNGINFISNTILVEIDKSNTNSLAEGKYYHELQLIDSLNQGGVISSGTFTLEEPLHKRT
jgi:hypothetical protein